jgi:hypothetical protein
MTTWISGSTRTPSQGLRVLTLADYLDAGGSNFGVFEQTAAAALPTKAGADTTDFVFDGTAWLSDCSDTFTGWLYSISGPDIALTAIDAYQGDMQYALLLSGGTLGQSYAVTVTLATAAGRTINLTATILIDASQGSATGSGATGGGTILTTGAIPVGALLGAASAGQADPVSIGTGLSLSAGVLSASGGGGGGLSGSTLQLKGSTSTATYDAQIAVPDGGSEALQGTLEPAAARHSFLGWDSTEQVRIETAPGSSSFISLMGGLARGGPAIWAGSDTNTNVPLTIGASGLSGIYLVSGQGILAEFTGTALPATGYMTFVAGDTSNPTRLQAAGSSTLSLESTSGGVAIGPKGATAATASGNGACAIGSYCTASGSYSFAVGYAATATQLSSVALGYYSSDHYRVGHWSFANGHSTGRAAGSAQVGYNILRVIYTGTGTFRLTSDNGAVGDGNGSNNSVGFYGSSAFGSMLVSIKATVYNLVGDVASFFLDNALFIRTSGLTMTLVSGSPTAFTAGPATAGATGFSMSLAADSPNACMNVSITGSSASTWYVVASVQVLDNTP